MQFTPDLLPGDITGNPMLQEVDGKRVFVFQRGPIFANILLADEINRASPKTQSALLEAMQERRVTAGGETHALPEPFFVLATQNPIDLEGTYLKEGATLSLLSTDEYNAPLVASWARGAGRVAAVSFPLGGEFSERVRAWPGYGDFAQTLTRWLAGEDAPAGLALRTAVEGERLTLELLYDESWAARVAQTGGPAATLAEGGLGRGPEKVRPLVWEKIEPGRFRTTAELTPGLRVRGAVRLGNAALPFGPVTVSGLAEWAYDPARVQELRELSQRSGGRERLDLAAIWDAPRPVTARSIRGWLLTVCVLLVLADALLTRLEISLLPGRRKKQSGG